MTAPKRGENRARPGRASPSLRFAGMGLELGGAVIGFTLVGYWVDYHYGTEPRGLLTGAVLGVIGGFYNFIRQAIQLSKLTTPPSKDDAARRDSDSDDHA